MDATDELAGKLIEAFELLGEEIVLEQLAVPENLVDPAGSVDLWVASPGAAFSPFSSCGREDRFVVRGQLRVPTAVALGVEVEELSQLLWEELSRSESFRKAAASASVASRAVERGGGVPSPTEAERN